MGRFNPTYDPYDHLQSLSAQVQLLERNQIELMKSINQASQDIKILAESVATLQKLYLELAKETK
jgi:hypothetical protein